MTALLPSHDAAGARPARIVHLDGLRAIAFLMVFLHHGLHAPLLWMGVDLFFVLSGFLITGILVDLKDAVGVGSLLRQFYVRRLFRIVPPYYAVLLLVALAAPSESAGSWPWYVFFVSNVGDGFQWIAQSDALSPMWSLCVEEQFYLVWPWVVLALGRRGLALTAGAMIIAAPILRAVVGAEVGYEAVYRLTPCRMDLLAIGALLALGQRAWPDFYRRIRRPSLVLMVASAVTFGALAAGMSEFRTSANSVAFNVLGYSLSALFFGAVLGYAVDLRPSVVRRVLSNRLLVHVGSVSYVAYLTHRAFLVLAEDTFRSPIFTSSLALAGTLLVASLSWRYFEAPLIAYGRQVARSRR